MPAFNPITREARFKIVYCGPGYSGKTTNLGYIHSRLEAGRRGELVSLATAADRTLFFDFLPVEAVEIGGCKVSFQLYTVPGQSAYNATRQLVLRGVDGVVFVIDSQARRLEENVNAWRTMWSNLLDNGDDPWQVPMVLQFNKRDLPGTTPVADLLAWFNPGPERRAAFEAVAETGWNVFATLNEVSQQVLRRFFAANPGSPQAGRQLAAG
jgi:mutual gliding-motility protein MglA